MNRPSVPRETGGQSDGSPEQRARIGRKTPRLTSALRLRCPYCGVTPLRSPRAWSQFRDGCEICRYRFEREEGYFTGAAWIITYTAAVLPAVALGLWLLWRFPELDGRSVAAITAAVGAATALLLMPFGKALWLYTDHRLHPLADDTDRDPQHLP